MRGQRERSGYRPVRRNPWTTWPFYLLATVAFAALVVSVIQANVDRPPRLIREIVVPGDEALATVFVVTLGWVLLRERDSRQSTPILRSVSRWPWTGGQVLEPGVPAGRGAVTIRNVGPGVALITGVRWRLASTKGPQVEVKDMEALVGTLDDYGVTEDQYGISNYTPRTAIAAGEERTYFHCTQAVGTKLKTFDAVFQLQSLLGDRYERTVHLLPTGRRPA